MAITKKKATVLEVPRLVQGVLEINVRGTSPLIINRLSQKAMHELLMPERKTAGTRAANLKHVPVQEFRDSAYRFHSDDNPTRLALPAVAFKAAMRSAALRVEGASKQEVGEMLYVRGDFAGLVPIWGKPHMFSCITRNSDMNHTPDVRTRCIVVDWAARLQIVYTQPYLNETSVINLLAMAGLTQGVGDGRTNKGWGNFGSFEPINEDESLELFDLGGREIQDEMLANPVPFDGETGELVAWFDSEVTRRGVKLPKHVDDEEVIE